MILVDLVISLCTLIFDVVYSSDSSEISCSCATYKKVCNSHHVPLVASDLFLEVILEMQVYDDLLVQSQEAFHFCNVKQQLLLFSGSLFFSIIPI